MRSVLARGVAGSALLVLGGICYVRLAWPNWLIEIGPLAHIRSAQQARLVPGLTLSFLGLLLLTWAWWGLRRYALREGTGVGSVRLAIALWSVPMLFAPPLFSGDGWSYVATGYLTRLGLSPYQTTPSALPYPLRSGVSGRWIDTPSPYGPLALGWGGVASFLTSNPWLLLVAYRLFALLGVVLLAWATPRLAVRCGQDPGRASWLVLASPFMMAHGIGGLHNDVMVAGLGAAALALTTRDRWLYGAALAGAAAAVKIPGGLIAVGVVLLSLQASAGWGLRIRRTVSVAAVAGGTLLGLGLVAGVGTGWISTLSVPTLTTTQLSITYEFGLALNWILNELPGIGHVFPVVHTVQAIGVLIALGFAGWLLIRRFHNHQRDVLAAVASLMLLVTVLSPVERYWYFFWSLPLLACIKMPRPLQVAFLVEVAVLGLTPIADPALHHYWLTLTGSIGVLLLPGIAALIVVVRDRMAAAPRGDADEVAVSR